MVARIKIESNIVEKDSTQPFIVYKATNIINGDFYIGVTRVGLGKRAKQHFYDIRAMRKVCSKFGAAVRKYGEDSFYFEVIDTTDSFESLMSKEIELIAALKPKYNICRGGRGAAGAMTGKTHSKETRARLREHGLASLDNFKKYQYMGPASMRKQVVCLNTGIVYPSAKETSEDTGADRAAIAEVCLRYDRRLMAKNLVFRYWGDHLGGREEAEEVCRQKKSRWRGVTCISDNLQFDSIVNAATFYNVACNVVVSSCENGYLVSKKKLKFKYNDSDEAVRISDTEAGKVVRRVNAARACLAAKEAAYRKRTAHA